MTTSSTVTTVAGARDDLSRTLRRFRAGDLRPVVLGSHRSPEAVIVPYSTYRETGAPEAVVFTGRAPTLDDVRRRRRLIMRLADIANLDGIRITGSVARGDATADSDIDIIVDPRPEASLLDLAQFADDLEQLLGRPVDVLSSRALDPHTDATLLADVVPL